MILADNGRITLARGGRSGARGRWDFELLGLSRFITIALGGSNCNFCARFLRPGFEPAFASGCENRATTPNDWRPIARLCPPAPSPPQLV